MRNWLHEITARAAWWIRGKPEPRQFDWSPWFSTASGFAEIRRELQARRRW